ncbi:MAG: hypothetical protein ACR2IP_10490 [Solirubrobacteraceae bacterium]
MTGYWQRLRERLRSPRFELVFLYSLLYFIANVEPDLPEQIATAAKTLPLVAIVGWLLLPGRNGSQPGYQRLLARSRLRGDPVPLVAAQGRGREVGASRRRSAASRATIRPADPTP